MAPKKKKTHNKSQSSSNLVSFHLSDEKQVKKLRGWICFFRVVKRFQSDLLSCCCWCEPGKRKCMHFRLKWIWTKFFTFLQLDESSRDAHCEVFIVLLNVWRKYFLKSGWWVGWKIFKLFFSFNVQVASWASVQFQWAKSESLSHSTVESDWGVEIPFGKYFLGVENVSNICRRLIIFFSQHSVCSIDNFSDTRSSSQCDDCVIEKHWKSSKQVSIRLYG